MYYNIDTKQLTKALPEKIEVSGKVIYLPTLKECSLAGWREVPEVKPVAGEQIIAVTYVQSTKDPMKVEAVVTSKTDAAIAEDKALAEQVQADAQAQYAADRQKARDEITAAFTDKEQAVAIGKLFDAIRWLPQ